MSSNFKLSWTWAWKKKLKTYSPAHSCFLIVIVNTETQQASFPTGTVGPQIGIFLSPLNTNDGFYSSNHTFFLGKFEQAVNQYFVHILSLVTDNNPSWMIQRKEGEWP